MVDWPRHTTEKTDQPDEPAGSSGQPWRAPNLTLAHLWALSMLAVVFFFVSTHPIRPHDFWWHLQGGQALVTSGQIPTGVGLSYTTPDQAYPNYATFWLMQAAFYLIYDWGGSELVVLLYALIITASYGIILLLSQRESGSWRIAAVSMLFAAALGFDDWNVRPQGIAFLLGALFLWAIYGYRQKPRLYLLFVFPVAMLVWANSHGSIVIGFLLLVIWLADEVWQPISARLRGGQDAFWPRVAAPAAALLMASLAALINPRGAGIIAYVSGLSGNPIIRTLVPEWAPPTFMARNGALFLSALLLCAVLLAISPRRPSLLQLLTFLAFGALALSTARGIVWFGLAMAPVVASHLAALAASLPGRQGGSRPTQADRRLLNYMLASLLLVGALLATPWLKHLLPLPAFKQTVISSETPTAATAFLVENELPGPLFNELGFGSYLIWAAQPQYPVFVDTRLEHYPAQLWRDYLFVSAGWPGWEETLEDYGVNLLLLHPTQQAELVQAARLSPRWRLTYEDAAAILFARNATLNRSQE